MNRPWLRAPVGARLLVASIVCVSVTGFGLVSSPATAADVTDQLIPAFETDLATNQVTVAPASSNDGNCTIYASDPYKESGHIKGDGSQFCSGNYHLQRIKVTIEQYRGLGIWDKKASVGYTAWTQNDFLERFVSWTCAAGSGNQLYRVVTDGQFIGRSGQTYSAAVQSGNYLRTTCPS
jgi:hypothetical protein